MKKLTKFLLILFVVLLIPTIFLARSVFNGVSADGRAFSFNLSTEAIVGMVLLFVEVLLGIVLFIKFVLSQPLYRSIFFSSLPLTLAYGFSMYLLADMSSLDTPMAKTVSNLLNLNKDNDYNKVLWAVVISIIYIFLLFLNFITICKPISKMEKVVLRLGDGVIYDERVRIGGGSQFKNIEYGLNRINNNYQGIQYDGRLKFKPKNRKEGKLFLKFFGKEEFRQMENGKDIERRVVAVATSLYNTNTNENINLEESYQILNAYLTLIYPIVKNYGGIVDKYYKDKLFVVFKECESALNYCRDLSNQLRKSNRKNNLLEIQSRIVMFVKTCKFALMDSEYSTPQIVSNITTEAEILDEIAKFMSCDVIFTKQILECVNLDYKFYYRNIGSVTIDKKEIQIFENLDVLSREQISKSLKTKKLFEAGVFLYKEGNYEEATGVFKEVLVSNPKDKPCYVYYNNALKKLS